MNITLEPPSESALRALAERSGITVERYAAEALAAHVGTYDRWFVQAVEKGMKDFAEGRVLAPENSQLRDQARRDRLTNRNS
jgi:predicted transcriptional regulator